jgi:hypothetical protein
LILSIKNILTFTINYFFFDPKGVIRAAVMGAKSQMGDTGRDIYQLILVIWKISKQIYQLIATILLIILNFTNIKQFCFTFFLPFVFCNNIEFINFYAPFRLRLVLFIKEGIFSCFHSLSVRHINFSIIHLRSISFHSFYQLLSVFSIEIDKFVSRLLWQLVWAFTCSSISTILVQRKKTKSKLKVN